MEESHGDVKMSSSLKMCMDVEIMGDFLKNLTLELKLNIVIGLHQMNNEWKTI